MHGLGPDYVIYITYVVFRIQFSCRSQSVCSVATQTDYRDSQAQTLPYAPDIEVNIHSPSDGVASQVVPHYFSGTVAPDIDLNV